MAEGKRQNKPSRPSDARIALQSADAFRNLSKPFLDYIGRDMNVAHECAVRELGGMIASATTLALSVELYLKALRLLNGVEANYTHDLIVLFEGLPLQIKESVVRLYNTFASQVAKEGVAVSLDLHIAVGDFKDDQTADQSITDHSLSSVLSRSKDAFKTWRYLYEQGDHGHVKFFTYEFTFLDYAAEAAASSFGVGD